MARRCARFIAGPKRFFRHANEACRRSVGSRRWSKSRCGFLLERGYDNTPMSLLAKRLGLTKAGIYHHFASKEDLLFLVHQTAMGRGLKPVFDAAARETDPSSGCGSPHEHARMLALDPAAMLLIREARRLSRSICRTSRRPGAAASTSCAMRSRSCDDQGRCRADVEGDIRGLCRHRHGRDGSPYWFDPTRPESAEAVAKTMADIFIARTFGRTGSGGLAPPKTMRRSQQRTVSEAWSRRTRAGRQAKRRAVRTAVRFPYRGEDMDFEYSSEQKLLWESVHKLMQRVATPEVSAPVGSRAALSV